MGLRFYRRLNIAAGIGVNLSRSGPSLTLGVRGAHVTLGSRGVTRTVGLPGTGMFYTSRSGTLNIYTHVVDASHRKAIEAVERELFPSVPELEDRATAVIREVTAMLDVVLPEA